MQILTVSHPSPSKKRYGSPVVASDAPKEAAHQITAPPVATLLRMRQAKSLGCITAADGRAASDRQTIGTQQLPSPALLRCGIDSCPNALRAPMFTAGWRAEAVAALRWPCF